MIQSNITEVMSTLVLVSNVLFILFVLLIFLKKEFRKWVYEFINRRVLSLLFFFSFFATVGSLAYSNIAGFPPCELCWIQRIFMFPQPILLALALYGKDKGMVYYLAPLTIIGAIISFYHSISNWGFGSSLIPCTAVGGDCLKLYVYEYGYITIPFMAFTSFVFLLTISVIYYFSNNERI